MTTTPLDRAEAVFEAYLEAINTAAVLHLSGSGRFKEEFHDLVWRLLQQTAGTLAAMQDETPREVFEQAFGYAPSDEEWRDHFLPELERRAERIR